VTDSVLEGMTAFGAKRTLAKGVRIMLDLECLLLRGYCCKSRKSNDAKNLAKVDF
jgi:hypothetical protein